MNKTYWLYLPILFFFLQACSVSRSKYNPDKKFSKEELLADYDLLQNILEKKHPSLYWYTSKDSMDDNFRKYRAVIQDSMTELQFGWQVLAPVTNPIYCGHTSFMMSKRYAKWADNRSFPSIPFTVRAWNDSLILSTNLNRRDSVLKRGMIIRSINGYSSAKIIDSLFGFLSRDGNARNICYARLNNNFPLYHRNVFGLSSNYTITYSDTIGRPGSTKISLYPPPRDTTKKDTAKKISKPAVKIPKPSKKELRERIRSMTIDSSLNTAIITLNTFSSGRLRGFFRKSFRTIRKQGIKNVILDLRNNGGGKINSSTLLTKYVSRHPFKVSDSAYAVTRNLGVYTRYIKGSFWNNIGLWLFSKKRADGNYHFGYWERKIFQPKRHNHFDGQLYVLTAGQTFSASSLFCNAVKGQSGITLLGEETGGGWHGNSGILIPYITLPQTKLRVRLPLCRLVQYRHVPKNGLGVMPDILVPPNYDAFMNSYDKKMTVTKELIRRSLTNSP